eukprot:2091626-Rhodomonas_salina.1
MPAPHVASRHGKPDTSTVHRPKTGVSTTCQNTDVTHRPKSDPSTAHSIAERCVSVPRTAEQQEGRQSRDSTSRGHGTAASEVTSQY